MRARRVLMAAVVLSLPCCRDGDRRRAVDDEPATRSAPSSVAKPDADVTLESILTAYSAASGERIYVSTYSVESLRCVRVNAPADGALTKAFVQAALEDAGLRLTPQADGVRVSGRAKSDPACKHPRPRLYRIEKGRVEEHAQVLGSQPSALASSLAPPNVAAGVFEVGPNEYELAPETAAWIRKEGLEALAKEIPSSQAHPKIGHLAPGGLGEALGFQRDDVLLSLNGFSLSDPAQALDALAAIQRAAMVEIKLERGEKTVRLRFRERRR